MNKYINRIPLLAGILFLLTAVITVGSAWMADLHRFDLGISFSAYVGLRRSTSVLYFIAAVLMIALLICYIAKTGLSRIKRMVYAVVLICILGTAWFPFNYFSGAPTAHTSNIHNDFAICLMLATTVSFIITAVQRQSSKKQRLCAFGSIAYGAVFMIMYFCGFEPLFQVFFVVENLFILLLLLGLHMEQYTGCAS